MVIGYTLRDFQLKEYPFMKRGKGKKGFMTRNKIH